MINKDVIEFFTTEDSFEWGKRDCCLWVANILAVTTGVDYAKPFRGKYSSREGFKRLLVKNNVKDLESFLLGILGKPTVGGLAKTGHPVLLEQNGEQLLGICTGTVAVFLTEEGFTSRDIRFCKLSWEV